MRGVEIEQIISDITNIINNLYLQGFIKDNEGQVSEKLKDFLALYQRTRVENQKLSKELTIKICNEVEAKVFEEMRIELEQEKEKNKSLQKEINLMKDYQKNAGVIFKDKIREKIKELQEIKPQDDDYNFELQNEINFKIDSLQELLEE